MLALVPVRVAREAASLTETGEVVLAPGDDLVHVRLMAGIPEDGVLGRLEHTVQSERELHGAEVGSEVAAGLTDGLHHEVTNLPGQIGEFRVGERLQVFGRTD
ncbi:unannotated protein [freshwater metagenome]|uniref:Unannotated protein n=1 Tax=freshwater metagenome TaxID=449393 RepID=A0A6J6SFR3_9ZZZZ